MEIKGLKEIIKSLEKAPKEIKDAVLKGITRGTLLVHRDSIRNAPVSPSLAQIARNRKTRIDTRKKRKATAYTRAKRGGLQRSIEYVINHDKIEGAVYVASNSEAGKYAARIHDEKGMTWSKRGIGTIAKGLRADDKFIERALLQNQQRINEAIMQEIEKVQL